MGMPARSIVLRITRSKRYSFPSKAKHVCTDFLPLLELTLIGKQLMTIVINVIDNRKRKAASFDDDEDVNPMMILP